MPGQSQSYDDPSKRTLKIYQEDNTLQKIQGEVKRLGWITHDSCTFGEQA